MSPGVLTRLSNSLPFTAQENENVKPKYLMIEGYESQTQIYRRKIPIGSFTERQLEALLKALAAKAGLENDEIVGAYAKRRTKIANDLLEVTKETSTFMYSCGLNPYFTARPVNE